MAQTHDRKKAAATIAREIFSVGKYLIDGERWFVENLSYQVSNLVNPTEQDLIMLISIRSHVYARKKFEEESRTYPATGSNVLGQSEHLPDVEGGPGRVGKADGDGDSGEEPSNLSSEDLLEVREGQTDD